VFKIVWDITVLAMIILNIFYIPMKLAFDLEENTSMLDLLLDTLPSWVSF
jgi:potassium voltage-gated channel Eag-related subfamily H protein 5